MEIRRPTEHFDMTSRRPKQRQDDHICATNLSSSNYEDYRYFASSESEKIIDCNRKSSYLPESLGELAKYHILVKQFMMEAVFIIIFNFQSQAQRKLSVSHVLLDLTQLKDKLVIIQRILDRPNGRLASTEARITLTCHLTKCCGHIKEERLRG